MAEMKDLDVDAETDGLTVVAHRDLGVIDGYHGQLEGIHSDSDVDDEEISLEVKDTNLFHSDLDLEQPSKIREDEVSEPVVRNIQIFIRIIFFC